MVPNKEIVSPGSRSRNKCFKYKIISDYPWREDNKKSVKVIYHPERIPEPDEDLSNLLTKCIVDTATPKQKERFKEIWQSRVKAVLFEEADGLFEVKETG